MSSPVISLENVSKSYIISHQHKGVENTLRDKIAMATQSFINRKKIYSGPSDELFWALKDISFDVHRGDRLAIIGSNGAGKSTLLKLLSRITAPSKGKITIEGKVASLLEVGTGFHPELTGRENIFLNGTILGMNRKEIKYKFDEIVDFSGVEKFLDTPVKRFSSGMYVRLAFAVAAHLDSEILIVDEVLALGDADFQKKCLGKMNDVSLTERTILFVSHTLTAIQSLCNKAIYLQNGMIVKSGALNSVLNEYHSGSIMYNQKLSEISDRKGNGYLKFINGTIESDQHQVETFKDLKLVLDYRLNNQIEILQYKVEIEIINAFGQKVALLSTYLVNSDFNIKSQKLIFKIRNIPLVPGSYRCTIKAEINKEIADIVSDVIPFEIIEKDYYNSGRMAPFDQVPILLDYEVY